MIDCASSSVMITTTSTSPPASEAKPAPRKFSPFSVDSLLSHRVEKEKNNGHNNNNNYNNKSEVTPRAVVLPQPQVKDVDELKQEEEDDDDEEANIDVCGIGGSSGLEEEDEVDEEDIDEDEDDSLNVIGGVPTFAPTHLHPRFPLGIPIGPGGGGGGGGAWPGAPRGFAATGGIPWIAQFRSPLHTGSESLVQSVLKNKFFVQTGWFKDHGKLSSATELILLF
jgi:hypothetical protein